MKMGPLGSRLTIILLVSEGISWEFFENQSFLNIIKVY
jgi:hypothetical protein